MVNSILYRFFLSLVFVTITNAQRYELSLGENGTYVVGWSVNAARQEITFDVAVETTGYVGLGVSRTASMWESDIALAFVFPNGSTIIEDCFGTGPSRPSIDAQQDWHVLYGYESETHTYIRFWRKLDTGDSDDLPIENAETNLIWSWGGRDMPGYHGPNRGSVQINLLNPGNRATHYD